MSDAAVIEEEGLLGSPVLAGIEVETYSLAIPDEQLIGHLVPLLALRIQDELVELRRPVVLRLGMEGGAYFVENQTLGIFGHGPTVKEAVDEFQEDLAYYLNYYRGLAWDQVSGEGRRLKEIYATLG